MAITTRAAKGSELTHAEMDTNFTDLRDLKAALASPAFTGLPTAPTAAPGASTTQIATTAFVAAAVGGGGGGGGATDAELRDRATHTGTQAIATVTGLQAALDAKPALAGALGGTAATPTALGLADNAALVAMVNAAIATSGAGVSRTITGADTIITSDVTGATIQFNSASTAVLTIPSDATLAIVAGKAQLAVFIQGAGVPTFAGSGATLLGAPRVGLAQDDTIVLNHTGIANTWSYA